LVVFTANVARNLAPNCPAILCLESVEVKDFVILAWLRPTAPVTAKTAVSLDVLRRRALARRRKTPFYRRL
jgi:hypothetical protein